MLHQIKCLTAVQSCNLFGINVIRYGKDKTKRTRFIGMGILYAVLILILWGYLGAFIFGMVSIGIGELVPYYLYMIVSLIILCFSFFKAANVIFQVNTYEMQISLPVSKAAIVTSRFLTMYLTDLLIGLAVLVPGGILYGILMKPSFAFYIWGVLGAFFLPCIPLTIATAAGSLIFALSSRMRYKNLANIILSVGLIIVILVINFGVTGNQESLEQIDMTMLVNLAETAIRQIQKVYPPAGWFGNSVVGNDPFQGGLLLVISFVSAGGLLFILQKYFTVICSALNTTSAKNNYKMGRLSGNSVMKALWKREMKRYFASSVYVTNTIVGYILAVMMAAALWIFGGQEILEMSGLPVEINVPLILPYVLAVTGNLMPMTACSISMEGKQWWMAQTLPITMKQILDGKILAQLSIALPFFVAAEVFAFLAVKPSLQDGIWLIMVPLVYTLFLSVAGLMINLLVPIFDWENEVRVVKQSASTMLTLLLNMVSSLIPIALLILFGNFHTVINIVTVIGTGGLTVLFYVIGSGYQKFSK